ncbi:MAG: hypothetical protein K6F98_01470 [Bacteroidales bacterium]|nr:hypothetical protein [Bacteroidales bacterium]
MRPDRYTEDMIVPSYLTDRTRCMSPVAAMAIVQELSYSGGDQVGLGDSLLTPQGLAWVYSRLHFVIYEAPAFRQPVRLETWHRGLSGPYFLRDYRITDTAGRPLVAATAASVIIDIASRSLRRIDRIEGVDTTPQGTEQLLERQAGKIVLPSDIPGERVLSHRVDETDLDFVGHTNNLNYLRWALACERRDGDGAITRPADVAVAFLHETHLGETVDYVRYVSGEQHYYAGYVGDRHVVSLRISARVTPAAGILS